MYVRPVQHQCICCAATARCASCLRGSHVLQCVTTLSLQHGRLDMVACRGCCKAAAQPADSRLFWMCMGMPQVVINGTHDTIEVALQVTCTCCCHSCAPQMRNSSTAIAFLCIPFVTSTYTAWGNKPLFVLTQHRYVSRAQI
jgi:hypothetical protein